MTLEPIGPDVARALQELLAGHTCQRCGVVGEFHVTRAAPPHYARVDCACGAFVRWASKPENLTRRRDNNHKHRADWIDIHDGDLQCAFCLVRQSETRSHMVVDHIIPLERGGIDEIFNTRILCGACDRIRHALVDNVQHLSGRSARDHGEAA